MLQLRNTQYILIEERNDTPELGPYASFGIMAVRRTGEGDQQLAYVRDVSTNRAFAGALVKRCNSAQLSPVHLRDFIEDALET